jgi:hypothetical protein
MKVLVVVLLVLVGYLADRVVRLENQRYALMVGMCQREIVPGARRVPDFNCLNDVQTRTWWGWHLFYAVVGDVPAVPILPQD